MFFLFFRIKELHWLKKNTLDKAETFIELESLVSSFASYSVCASNVTFNKTLHQHLVIRIKIFKENFVKSTWFCIVWLLTTLISRKKRWNSLGFFPLFTRLLRMCWFDEKKCIGKIGEMNNDLNEIESEQLLDFGPWGMKSFTV